MQFKKWLISEKDDGKYGDWLKGSLNMEPNSALNSMPIVMADLEIKDGDKTHKYPKTSLFRVLKISPDRKWAIIQDINYSDNSDSSMPDFPSGSVSTWAGKKFLISGDQMNKIISPRIQPQQPEMPQNPAGGEI